MRMLISWLIVAGMLCWTSAVQGQTLLERLEGRLNRVLPPAGQPTPAELPAPADGRAGYLGLSADDAAPDGRGVLVESVREAGPAEAAGLQPGDLITAVNGRPVRNVDDMDAALSPLNAGAKVPMSFERDGKRQTLTVTLGTRPPAAALDAEDPGAPPTGDPRPARPAEPREVGPLGRASLGITVTPLTEEARARYGITVRRGALISAVRAGTPADRAGLPVGGVVVAVDGKRIETSDELIALIRAAEPGEEMELSYYQGDRLARKTIRLSTAALAIAPGLSIEIDPPADSGPRGDRPLLRKVERLIDDVARGGAVPNGVPPGADTIAVMQQRIDALEEEVRSLAERIKLLEMPLERPAANRGANDLELPLAPPARPAPPRAAP